MKLYRNVSAIESKEKLGRRFSSIGLLVLLIGLGASFIPSMYPPDEPGPNALIQFLQAQWTTISFIALPMGFIFASLGSYFINRFASRFWPGSKQRARPDEILERSMKGLDNKYALFLWSLPASYVLVGPCGILIFAVRSDQGRVTVQGEKFREPFGIGRIFTVFAREGVGNPLRDIEDQQRKISELLNDEHNVPVDGVVVFLNSKMQIELDEPSIAVLRSDQIKEFVRRKTREVRLKTSVLRSVTEELVEHADFGITEE